MKIYRVLIAFFCLAFALSVQTKGQHAEILDQIIGIVGNKAIKYSDVENEYKQLVQSENKLSDNPKCDIFEYIIKQKMLFNQAIFDSLEINETSLDAELNNKLNQNINYIGSVDKLEKYFNKSIQEIKEDLRTSMKEMRLAGQMQDKVIENISITPSEVKKFYEDAPKDSLPFIKDEIEIAQIAAYPPYSEEAIAEVKNRLLEFRKRILNGDKFEVLARLYSEDPGSANKGGEYGFSTKGELDPEFGKAAFALKKPGEISRIVESENGYHIIQLIERRGDRINFRHILLKPQIDPDVALKLKNTLDSIANLIRNDSITFEKAVRYYSMDEDTRYNDGLMINPNTGNNRFEMDQLAPVDYYYIKKLKPGEISDSYESRDSKGKILYKFVTIKKLIPAHRANIELDYNLLEQMALNMKRTSVLNEWYATKRQNTYIHVDDLYKTCDFTTHGWFKLK